MTIRDRETDVLSDDIRLLSDDQLEAASAGTKWIDVHMFYEDLNKMPVNAPQPTRYA